MKDRDTVTDIIAALLHIEGHAAAAAERRRGGYSQAEAYKAWQDARATREQAIKLIRRMADRERKARRKR